MYGNCEVCGSAITSGRPSRKTCSATCHDARRAEWMHHYNASRYVKKQTVKPDQDCPQCGVRFSPNPKAPRQVYCSRNCTYIASQAAKVARRGATTGCYKCGVETPRAKAGHTVCADCKVDPRTNGYGRERARTLRRYGITQADYDAMVEAQGNRCAICRTDDPGRGGRPGAAWSIDHCHDSMAVRGLLCSACNMALGLLCDDVDALRAAIDYLNSSRMTAVA